MPPVVPCVWRPEEDSMEPERANRGAVVITGCSTGIGRATALHLARSRHRVFAGVRSAGHATSLEAESSRISGLVLDVTDAASIEAAAKRVEAEFGATGLAGLVNNA